MLSVSATNAWRNSHPGAVIGLLACSGIDNAHPSPALNQRKRDTETSLRAKYSGSSRQDFLTQPVIAAYNRYYKRFDKTYHVQLQVESIVLKGKSLPTVSPLVDSNFIAEVQTFILTAGHDVSKLHGAVTIDVSRENDEMQLMNGIVKTIRARDMVMRDGAGICCSIIYGQDNRSPITPVTSNVLYVSYAPAGIQSDQVELHMRKIVENIRLFSQAAVVEQCSLLCSDQPC